MTNRQLAAQETRKKLLEAAKKLICEKGLLNTSISEITQACGVANGTFYTYFKRKEDVVFALSREMFQEILEGALCFSGPMEARLTHFMTRFSGYIEKSGLRLCQEWVRNTVDPDLIENEDDKNKLARDLASLREVLALGVRRGELRADTPVELLARTLTDLLYGEMLCWDMSGGAYSFEERTREFCSAFLGGMLRPYLNKELGKDE